MAENEIDFTVHLSGFTEIGDFVLENKPKLWEEIRSLRVMYLRTWGEEDFTKKFPVLGKLMDLSNPMSNG